MLYQLSYLGIIPNLEAAIPPPPTSTTAVEDRRSASPGIVPGHDLSDNIRSAAAGHPFQLTICARFTQSIDLTDRQVEIGRDATARIRGTATPAIEA